MEKSRVVKYHEQMTDQIYSQKGDFTPNDIQVGQRPPLASTPVEHLKQLSQTAGSGVEESLDGVYRIRG